VKSRKEKKGLERKGEGKKCGTESDPLSSHSKRKAKFLISPERIGERKEGENAVLLVLDLAARLTR